MNQETLEQEPPYIQPVAPLNIFAHAQNGLTGIEVWQQGVAERINEACEDPLARAKQREQLARDRLAQAQRIQHLQLRKLVAEPKDAANCQRQLDGALVEYHQGLALQLGSRVVELTVERPRFAGIRTRFAEMRQAYHGFMARKAAGRLIRAA